MTSKKNVLAQIKAAVNDDGNMHIMRGSNLILIWVWVAVLLFAAISLVIAVTA